MAAEYRVKLERIFEEAAEHFARGNPKGKIAILRKKMKEVAALGVKLRCLLHVSDHKHGSPCQLIQSNNNTTSDERVRGMRTNQTSCGASNKTRYQ